MNNPRRNLLHMEEVLQGSFVPKTPKPLCAKMGDPMQDSSRLALEIGLQTETRRGCDGW